VPDTDRLVTDQPTTVRSVEEISPATWTEAILRTLAVAGEQALTLRDIQISVGRLVPSIGTPPVAHEIEVLRRHDFVRCDDGRAAVRLTPDGQKLAQVFAQATPDVSSDPQ